MELDNPFRLEMEGKGQQWTVEALDHLMAMIGAAWDGQHKIDGTHGNVTFALGSATAYGVGAGIWMAPDLSTGLYQLRVGDPAGNQLTWDGTNLSVTGAIVATSGSFTGTITASSGTIGGWTINSTSLTGGNATLAASGNLTLGTLDDVARISADDGTYRLWIGHAVAASAPFRVDKGGTLVATNATITGAITATSGSFTGTLTSSAGTIGGWTLGASSLTGGNATLASSGNLTLGTVNDVFRASADDATYRLWIGHATAASAPFRVTKAGVVTMTNASITGTGQIDINGNILTGGTIICSGGLATLAEFSAAGACILGSNSGDATTVYGTLNTNGNVVFGLNDPDNSTLRCGTVATTNDFCVLQAGLLTICNTATTTKTQIDFQNGNGSVGTITTNGTTTTYNTTSDERLKVDHGRAGDFSTLLAVDVRDFHWRADGTPDRGVFAQREIGRHPRAVTRGDDDAPWMVDYSKYVPDLIGLIQDHDARLRALETR